MSKRRHASQLDLDLSGVPPKKEPPKLSGTVVPFLDAATLAVRRDAVRRVATTGIFALDPRLQKK
jgi:hypothetical protein